MLNIIRYNFFKIYEPFMNYFKFQLYIKFFDSNDQFFLVLFIY